MGKNTLKSSFGKGISFINSQKLMNGVNSTKQDYYTKKLTTESFLKLMLFAQLYETESLHALSDLLSEEL